MKTMKKAIALILALLTACSLFAATLCTAAYGEEKTTEEVYERTPYSGRRVHQSAPEGARRVPIPGYEKTDVKKLRGVTENADFETLDELGDRLGLTYGLPSTGSVPILVIPIVFTNSDYDLNEVCDTLEKGFNGTPEQTGWHSLRSYYETVSFGNLHFSANILDPYQTGEAFNKRANDDRDAKYLADALTYYDPQIDYSSYDANKDGYIDCVYLVYLAPYDANSDLWWAYTTEYEEDEEEMRLDGKGVDWYMWLSFEFFHEGIMSAYNSSDSLGVTVNAETIIHETGHAMGLDDYYDYVGQKYGGLGALNMMDANQGDHDPFSKAIMGWIHPTVYVSGAYQKTLGSFTNTGDALFISKNGEDSYFGEYYVVVFYTPDGVNAIKADKEVGIIGISGVLVYHVDATLKKNPEWIVEVYEHNNGEKTDRLIKIVGAGSNNIDKTWCAADSDLFQAGAVLNLKWYDGTNCPATLRIDSVTENGAVVSLAGAAQVLYGDVLSDGFVNKKDSLALKRYLADNTYPIDVEAADVYFDGLVNKKDSLRLKQYLAGWDVVLGSEQPVHEHRYAAEVTTAATCTTPGMITHTCSCGASYTEAIPALGHDFDDDGVCTRCGFSVDRSALDRLREFIVNNSEYDEDYEDYYYPIGEDRGDSLFIEYYLDYTPEDGEVGVIGYYYTDEEEYDFYLWLSDEEDEYGWTLLNYDTEDQVVGFINPADVTDNTETLDPYYYDLDDEELLPDYCELSALLLQDLLTMMSVADCFHDAGVLISDLGFVNYPVG